MITFDPRAIPTLILIAAGFIICVATVGWRAAFIFLAGAAIGSIRLTG